MKKLLVKRINRFITISINGDVKTDFTKRKNKKIER